MTSPDETAAVRVLPRGRHAAAREVVWESQRERMLEAIAAAVAEKGYARVAVADVIARARVSRRSFYEHFENKDDCFLAAYDEGVARLLAAIDEEVRLAAPDWLAAAVAGTRAYLEMLADNPAFARTFLVEVLAAGTPALHRRGAVHRRFAEQVAAVHRAARADMPELPEVPEHLFRAHVGAVNELVTDHLVHHGAETLPDLLPALLELEVALLFGRELAERLQAG